MQVCRWTQTSSALWAWVGLVCTVLGLREELDCSILGAALAAELSRGVPRKAEAHAKG